MRCGATCFNGPRHRCHKALERRAAWAIVAAHQYCDARQAVRCATIGTVTHSRAVTAELEKFDQLVAALAAVDEDTTNGREV